MWRATKSQETLKQLSGLSEDSVNLKEATITVLPGADVPPKDRWAWACLQKVQAERKLPNLSEGADVNCPVLPQSHQRQSPLAPGEKLGRLTLWFLLKPTFPFLSL